MLSAVLHLGNVSFAVAVRDNMETAVVHVKQHIAVAAGLLVRLRASVLSSLPSASRLSLCVPFRVSAAGDDSCDVKLNIGPRSLPLPLPLPFSLSLSLMMLIAAGCQHGRAC